jgi:DNA-binding CsgD family transcriptional regulator
MELPQPTHLLPATGPTVDPDRFVSLVLLRDGVPEAFLFRVPAPTASSADGAGAMTPAGTSGDALISEVVDALMGRTRGISPTRRERPPIAPSSAEIPDPISAAEARVLRYLPTNLTASEIAAELTVSVHTVKTHMRRIYSKLDAHRRRDAVERARALGLLPTSLPRRAHR